MVEDILILNTRKLVMNNKNWNYTILQLCEELGISVPRFCYHRELSIVGNCRMCMVELKSSIKPVIACATSLSKNMQIFTNSELVKTARGNVLEFLLINHPLDCPICDQGGECDLQDQAFLYGSDKSRFTEYKRSVEDKNFGPVIKTVMSRCIHCTRCVRYAEEIIGVFSIGTMGRGKETEISTYNNSILYHEMIGNIADVCPVGALLIKPTAFRARTWDLESLDLLDVFDSLVSTASMGVKGNELIRVLPRRNDSLNREWITDRLRFFYEGSRINRLLYPLVRSKDKLIHSSLFFTCNLYAKKLSESYSQKNALLGLIGEELNFYDSFLISYFSNYLNIFCVYADQYKKSLNSDLRVNWLLNNNTQSFIKNNSLLFLNVNLKYESPILNSLLYKNLNESDNQTVYYIGAHLQNHYKMIHLGIDKNTLNKIQKGQHYFCFDLIKNSLCWVESSIQPLIDNSLNNYLSSIKNFVKTQTMSYLASNSTEINLLELGVPNISSYEELNDKKFNLIHFFGNISNVDLIWNSSSYKVYFSHHMPDKYIDKYDIYLPILNFHEWSANTTGPKARIWLNNQLMSQTTFDHVSTDAGKPESYHNYLYLFLDFLDRKYMKLEGVSSFFEQINTYFEQIDLLNKYNNIYVNKLTINNSFNSSVSSFVSHVISPDVYYKNSAYSRNSNTISAMYEENIYLYKNIFK